MKIVYDLFVTALYAVFVQNMVMSFGLGSSEAIRASSKPDRFISLAAMISGFSVATSVICKLIDMFTASAELPYALRAAVYGGVLAGVYFIAAFAALVIFKASKKAMGTLGISALNTLVFAVPFINNTASYSFANCIGSGIGAGIAFVLAAALISRGAVRLAENKDIPAVFKGTPAMFIYVGILSLAFSGFADSTLFS
ncbi:MAG: hypothetical protein MJ173_05645 [Clostridia bacterium]|nr:hypothetical protein [Clostridia bacterium]